MKKQLLTLATAVSVGLAANMASADELTAVSFGGAYGAAQQKHMIDP